MFLPLDAVLTVKMRWGEQAPPPPVMADFTGHLDGATERPDIRPGIILGACGVFLDEVNTIFTLSEADRPPKAGVGWVAGGEEARPVTQRPG